jgi:hypothetical protein
MDRIFFEVQYMKKTILLVVGMLLFITVNPIILSNRIYMKTTYESSVDTNVVDMIQQVDEDLVYYYLTNLLRYSPRYTGTLKCELAGDYIFNEFEKMGLDVAFHDWCFDGYSSRNVVATLNGTDPSSDAVFIISAHYDTVEGSQGADDDGSGVAGVMAIASVCSNYSFNHTIRFVCFSGEEVGTYGSFSYAHDAYIRGENIVAVLNIDMIGVANSVYGGKIIRFSHEKRSTWIAEFASQVSEKYIDILDMTVEDLPNYRGHDAQPFLDYGYDGVWIHHHDSYKWANTPNDTIDFINFTYLAKASRFLFAVLAEFANRPIDLQVILKKPREGTIYFFNRSIPLSFAKYFFTRLRGTTIIFGKTTASVEVKSNEEIKFVVFCIDNNFVHWDRNPPYEWNFSSRYYSIFGRYTLRVYAYTMSGSYATDEMDIILFSLRK